MIPVIIEHKKNFLWIFFPYLNVKKNIWLHFEEQKIIQGSLLFILYS